MSDTAIWILIIVMGVVAISLLAIDIFVIAPWYDRKQDAARKKWIQENKNDRERE